MQSTIVSIIIPSLNQIHSQTFKGMPTSKFFDAVSENGSYLPCFNNTYSSLFTNVQLELIHHHIKFHPDQIESVGENETNRFCFVLTLWPPGKVKVKENGTEW